MGTAREKSQLVKTYERALGTKVNLNPSHDQNFYNKLFDELSNHNQLKSILYGLEPGVLGTEELILLGIWTKPLISKKGEKRD